MLKPNIKETILQKTSGNYSFSNETFARWLQIVLFPPGLISHK